MALALRHHIPDAPLEHEAERLNHPVADFLPALVAQRKPGLAPHRLGDDFQEFRLVAGLEPAARIEVEARTHPPRLGLPVGGQRGEQLQLGSGRLVPQAEIAGGAGQAGKEQRSRLGCGEPIEAGLPAIEEGKATIASGLGINRHAGGAQLVDVPVDSSDRNLQLVGEDFRTGSAPSLEDHQDGEETTCAHEPSLPPVP